MTVNAEQTRLALKIDRYVKDIESRGGGDEQILASMEQVMPDFGDLMRTTSRLQKDLLAAQYRGFRTFAVLLTGLASGIKSGLIEVPK